MATKIGSAINAVPVVHKQPVQQPAPANQYRKYFYSVDPDTGAEVLDEGFREYFYKQTGGRINPENLDDLYLSYAQEKTVAQREESGLDKIKYPKWYDPTGKVDDTRQFYNYMKAYDALPQSGDYSSLDYLRKLYDQDKQSIEEYVQYQDTLATEKAKAKALGLSYTEGMALPTWNEESPLAKYYAYTDSEEDKQRQQYGLPPVSYTSEFSGTEGKAAMLAGELPVSVRYTQNLYDEYAALVDEVNAMAEAGTLNEWTLADAFIKYAALDDLRKYYADRDVYETTQAGKTESQKRLEAITGTGEKPPKALFNEGMLADLGLGATFYDDLLAQGTAYQAQTQAQRTAEKRGKQLAFWTNALQKGIGMAAIDAARGTTPGVAQAYERDTGDGRDDTVYIGAGEPPRSEVQESIWFQIPDFSKDIDMLMKDVEAVKQSDPDRFGSTIQRGWKSGQLAYLYNIEMAKEMLGQENRAEEIRALLDDPVFQTEPKNLFLDIVESSVEQTPRYWEALRNLIMPESPGALPEGDPSFTGTLTETAGTLGDLTMLPALYWEMAGGAYAGQIQAGVAEEVAAVHAPIQGMVDTFIEVAQLDLIFGGAKKLGGVALKKISNKAIARIAKALGGAFTGYGSELGEELAQEINAIVWEELGKGITGQMTGEAVMPTNFDDVAGRLSETLVEASKALVPTIFGGFVDSAFDATNAPIKWDAAVAPESVSGTIDAARIASENVAPILDQIAESGGDVTKVEALVTDTQTTAAQEPVQAPQTAMGAQGIITPEKHSDAPTGRVDALRPVDNRTANVSRETQGEQSDMRVQAATGEAIAYAQQHGNPDNAKPLNEITLTIRNWLEIPINQRVFRRPKGATVNTAVTSGWYQARTDIIGIREAFTLDTWFHEIGHKMDASYKLQSGPVASLESGYLTPRITQNYKEDQYYSEMVADFFKDYVSAPETARQNAPDFYDFVDSKLSAKDKAQVAKVRQMLADFLAQPTGERIASHVAEPDEKSKENIKTASKRAQNRAETWLFNEKAPIDWFSRSVAAMGDDNVARNPSLWAAYADYSMDVAGNIIESKLFAPMEKDGTLGRELGDSFKSLFQWIKSPQKRSEFTAYLVAKHAIDRDAAGKTALPGMVATTQEIKDQVAAWESKHKDFKENAEKLYKWWGTFIKAWYVDTGMLEESAFETFQKTYPHYVPFYRQAERGEFGNKFGSSGFSGQTTHIRGAKKSDLRIIDPIASMHRDIARVVSAVNNRQVMLSVVEAYDAHGKDLNEFLYEVAPGKIAETSRITELKQNLKAALSEKLRFPEAYAEAIIEDQIPSEYNTSFRPRRMSDGTEADVLTVIDRNGKERFFMSDNPMFIKAITASVSPKDANVLLKGMAKAMNAFKGTITFKNPVFAMANIMRDTGEGLLFGSQKWAGEFAFDLGASAVDTVRSLWLKKAGKEPEGMKAYRQMGGGGDAGLYTGTGLRKTINQKVMPTQSLAARQRAARIIKAPTEAIEAFNNTLETMNRYAEFQRSKRQGKSDLEAFNNSLEITLNFRRKGSWAKLLDPIIPFYNAMMQDIYKTARVVRNADTVAGRRQLGRLLTRLLLSQAMIGVLEVLLHSDDDEYKDLPRDMKDKYWILWRNPSGTFVKIPKPASIFPRFFSGMGRRATDYIRGDKQAFRGFGESMASEVWPTTIFDPLIAIASNRTWYGGIIENYSDKEVQSVYRYDENTSEIAKWIGKVTGRWGSADGSGFTDGMSPKEIQYVIDQYTGILGDMILPFTTKNTTGSAVTKMVANRFVVDPVLTNRHMNEFYDFAGEIEQIKETIERHGTYDGLKSVPAVALHGAESLHSGAIKRGEALIKEYRKAVDAMDKQGLSPEERTKQGRALRDALNEKLKEINKELIAYLRKVK